MIVDAYTLQKVTGWRRLGRSWPTIAQNLGGPVDRIRELFSAPPVLALPPSPPRVIKGWSFWEMHRTYEAPNSFAFMLRQVCELYGVEPEMILSETRVRAVAWPRQHFMALCVDNGKSLPQIGKYLGRDHTTILHGIRSFAARKAAA